jgi:F0F1-type ATP synthase delta subunit
MNNMQLSSEQLEQLLKSGSVEGFTKHAAVITSATKLDSADQKNVAQVIVNQIGNGIECEFQVDPDVIGGLKVEIGDFVFDGTVARQLGDLVKTLHT